MQKVLETSYHDTYYHVQRTNHHHWSQPENSMFFSKNTWYKKLVFLLVQWLVVW